MPSKSGGATRDTPASGPLRLRLCQPPDRQLRPMVRESTSEPWRVVTWSEPSDRRPRLPPDPGPIRDRRDRRHLLVTLHQRGGVCRPEDGARGLRQQQCRHLRAGAAPHRLRPQPDLRHLGGHPGLRLGRAGRCHPAHRCQPHRCPPGLRLPAQAPATCRGPHHRGGPAPHQAGPLPHVEAAFHLPVRRGPMSPSSTPWRMSSSPRACDADFLSARCENVEDYLAFIARPEHAPEAVGRSPAYRRRPARRRQLYATGGMRRSTTASA